ncbi:unnamed protein product [Pocillopora meandrina]|uniref:Uncharacterized protein n=1 Tax=Pocillopora meandrina TaxID=46732 RepID=A0AAU9XAS3_9CNID|nr:unnamed protein product [Pocillopora meandrina]
MADMDSSIDQRKRVLLLHRILAEKRRRILTQHALLSYHEEIWKRIHMLLLILCISTNSRNSNRMVARSCRRVIRNTGWWANLWNTYSHARFKKLFRVSRGLFFFILGSDKEPVRRETTEGSSIEFIGYRMPQHEQNDCTVLFTRH